MWLDHVHPSNYPDSRHGPQPPPDWVITTGARASTASAASSRPAKRPTSTSSSGPTPPPAGRRCSPPSATAAAEHRMFHRDAGYLEGRRVRKSRETRAMATRTDFGRQLIAGQWAATEFELLGRLWASDVAVPYPVQLSGTELLLEFIGDDDGRAAPRLAETVPVRTSSTSGGSRAGTCCAGSPTRDMPTPTCPPTTCSSTTAGSCSSISRRRSTWCTTRKGSPTSSATAATSAPGSPAAASPTLTPTTAGRAAALTTRPPFCPSIIARSGETRRTEAGGWVGTGGLARRASAAAKRRRRAR